MNPHPTKAPVQGLLYKMNSEVPTSSMADPIGQMEVKVIVHDQDNATVRETGSSPREEDRVTTHQGYVNEGLETENEDILSPHKIELDGFNEEGDEMKPIDVIFDPSPSTLRAQKQDSITNRTTQASPTSAPGQPNTVREQKPNSAK